MWVISTAALGALPTVKPMLRTTWQKPVAHQEPPAQARDAVGPDGVRRTGFGWLDGRRHSGQPTVLVS